MGRPDMVLFKFTQSMLGGENINIYNYGRIKRAFTFIDDVVEVVVRLQDKIPNRCNYNNNSSERDLVPCCIYNVAYSKSVDLGTIILMLEQILGIIAKKIFYQCNLEMFWKLVLLNQMIYMT